MKRLESIAKLRKMTPEQIRLEITDLETKLQTARFELAFSKSGSVRSLRVLKRNLAQALTIGTDKVRALDHDKAARKRDRP